MSSFILQVLKHFLVIALFLWLSKRNNKANSKKENRHSQFLMPICSFIYCFFMVLFASKIGDILLSFLYAIPRFIATLAKCLPVMTSVSQAVENFLNFINLEYWIFFIENIAILIVHIWLKRICIAFSRRIINNNNSDRGVFVTAFQAIHEFFANLFYDYDKDSEEWYLRTDLTEVRRLALYVNNGIIVFSSLLMVYVASLYKEGHLASLFYPVITLIMTGEIFYFLDGLTKDERSGSFVGEKDTAFSFVNYVGLRNILRDLFKDKIAADNTNVSNTSYDIGCDEMLSSWEREDTPVKEAYAQFMRNYQKNGHELDLNYLASGEKLLSGQSVLFNSPFYYDLAPYAFYSLNRTLIKKKKVLVIVGRHGGYEDIEKWLEYGFKSVTNLPRFWKVGILGDDSDEDYDVGILSRASVHDIKLHEENAEFFNRVGFIVLIEPSKLVTTAQIGLNSVIQLCKQDDNEVTFCSVDKNCNGLLDSLSHILMTKIDEVTATNCHKGACSYMSWEVDEEHLQHRLIPNLTHYLGIGTEISFVALKNQVSTTYWYGGSVFPVKDIHWIAKQYYYDLLTYANLPVNQDTMDSRFVVSAGIWDAQIMENAFIVVEDEDCNMFELKRQYATRVTNQSFINMISPNYLLRDYMNENNSIFDTDSKAIPYIVADYVRSIRNVADRLILRMCVSHINVEDVNRELKLIGIAVDDPIDYLWKEFLKLNKNIIAQFNGADQIIQKERVYSYKKNEIETLYYIDNQRFISIFAKDLQSATYIAENENGLEEFLGPELRSHVMQKYLPGQFMTFEGRYYEMLGLAPDGQILARRAADHITGRPCYRQVRKYKLCKEEISTDVAASVETQGMHVVKEFADFSVETPAYWNMSSYNDFKEGNIVKVSGIPQRQFYNKQILKIDFENASESVVSTLALLMNEVFRTLFSANSDYIVALVSGEHETPFTYSLESDGEVSLSSSCIYIVEDSQLDIGLLVAVERNINRIFSIICDYLDWHVEEVEKSKAEPPDIVTPPDFTLSEEEQNEENTSKIRKFFRKMKEKRQNFFKRIFGKKKNQEVDAEREGVEDINSLTDSGEEYVTPQEDVADDFGDKLSVDAEELSDEMEEMSGKAEASVEGDF